MAKTSNRFGMENPTVMPVDERIGGWLGVKWRNMQICWVRVDSKRDDDAEGKIRMNCCYAIGMLVYQI